MKVNLLDIIPGYVYHIKDEFFEKVNDDKLMTNKEGGTYRPTYFCIRDEKTALLWMIPMSSRVEKYESIYRQQMSRYGRCITIVIGEYDGRRSAFLLQNMFPILPSYIDHIHTRNENAVPVHTDIQKILLRDYKAVKNLIDRNIKIVFPDVGKIERLMLEEHGKEIAQNPPESLTDRLEKAKQKSLDQKKANLISQRDVPVK